MVRVSALSRPLVLTLCAATASANTYIVDDDGGPGVDFTQIAAALAFASPGDVLLVRPGNYAGFDVAFGVAILGTNGVVVQGPVRVVNVPAGPRVSLTTLSMTQLEIAGSSAPIVATDITVTAPFNLPAGYEACVEVRDAADVRFRALMAVPSSDFVIGCSALVAENARVELVQSTLRGRVGVYGDGANGTAGYSALVASTGAVVHISGSTLTGGTGGGATNYGNPWLGGHAGPGAPGIFASNGAQVLITGVATDVIRGGLGGYSDDCAHDGAPAPGITNSTFGPTSSVRHSGAAVIGAPYYTDCVIGSAPAFSGQHELAAPVDASLIAAGPLTAGTQVVFTLRGAPGDAARLRLGRQLAIVDLVDVYEDRLLLPLRTYDLGTLPASGVASFNFNLPSSLPAGFLVVAQGSCVDGGGVTRVSQSLPIVLR